MKSVRIRRRNICGFAGTGCNGQWVKTTPYGDYRINPIKEASKCLELGKNSTRNCHKKDRLVKYL